MGRVTMSCLWFAQDSGMHEVVVSELSWSTTDPLAMKITFTGKDSDVEWTFGYELLHDVVTGKSEAAGQGDVQFSKTLTSLSDQLLMRLSSPDGTVNLKCDFRQPREFVDLVQATNPHLFTIDIDAALARFLEGHYE